MLKLTIFVFMQKIIRLLSGILFLGIALFIFFLVVTGRGETTPPQSVENYEVKGADISAHNGDVDFERLKNDGIEFAYIKCTEGAGFKDSNFHENFRKAQASGIKAGAYHFFRFDSPGYMQALNMMHSIRGKDLDLPLAIDVEEWTNPSDRNTSTIVEQIKHMAETLVENGYKVVIYTNKDGFARFYRNGLEAYPLWLCSFTDIDKDVKWSFWQYSHRGLVKGLDRLVDLNVFNGSRDDWAEFTGSRQQ